MNKITTLVVAFLFTMTAFSIDYVNLEEYKHKNYSRQSESQGLSELLDRGWDNLKKNMSETFVTDNIDTDYFWNTLRNSLKENSLLNIVSNHQITTDDKFSDLFLKTVYSSVQQVPVKYKSITPNGDSVMLSGKIFLPPNKKAKNIIVANHYTICSNREAPSMANCIEGIFATKGYIVIMPDYIGYGISDSITHPYLQLENGVKTSIDMLNAAIPYLKCNSYEFSRSIILVGYSQGAALTLAMQKKMEQEYNDKYSIQNVYVGAGPYDLAMTYDYYVKKDTIDFPCILPMLIVGMKYGENLHINVNDFFTPFLQSLYSTLIESKSKATSEVNEMLGNQIDEILTPLALNKDLYPTKIFYEVLVKNSITDWNSQSKLYLFHSRDDNLVPFFNSANLYSKFQMRGSKDVVCDFDFYGNHIYAAVSFYEKVYRML